jgi:type II secretory pathway predicted ATPase ExeA
VALYLDHFGLTEPPFRITPHTDFFFDGADRGATLEALVYAILHDEGIVKVSGEVGSGKTMLCRVLMERLPAHVETLYLATPSLARDEILQAIADELDLELSQQRTSAALRELQEHLIRLYAEGKRVVVLVDEAHAMPEDTLEHVRLLSNLESNRHKLLQLVLFGQPELDQTLAKPTLRQLRDRITHSFRTRPLSLPEVTRYVSFRMRAAGYRGPDVFSPRALAAIARASSGLTRRINILADKALLAAFTENTHGVTERHVRAAVRDSAFAEVPGTRRTLARYASAALAAGVVLGIAIAGLLPFLLASSPRTEPGKIAAPAQPAPPASAPTTVVSPAAVVSPARAATDPGQAASAGGTGFLSPTQERRLGAYSAAKQPLLAERLNATRDVLQHSSDERYAIELFMTDNPDPARMERFLVRAREWVPLEQVFVVPVRGGRRQRLRVLFGDFDTRGQAEEASHRLPPRYQAAFKTVPRSFAELRGQI